MDAPVPAGSFRLAEDPGIRVLMASAGLACCALEVEAAVRGGLIVPDDRADRPRHTVLLVSGTVTDVLAPAIVRMHGQLEGPVSVLSFGACACTGGPYWDAPTVTKGIDQLLPVAAYVPGCPPRPEALVAALRSHAAGATA